MNEQKTYYGIVLPRDLQLLPYIREKKKNVDILRHIPLENNTNKQLHLFSIIIIVQVLSITISEYIDFDTIQTRKKNKHAFHRSFVFDSMNYCNFCDRRKKNIFEFKIKFSIESI